MGIEMILYHPEWEEIKHYSAEKFERIKIKTSGDDGIIKFLDWINTYIEENNCKLLKIDRETLTITFFLEKRQMV